MDKITDLIDSDQVIKKMDEEVADEIHELNSKIVAEISKKITQSINEMKKTERQLEKEVIDRKSKLLRKLQEIKNKQEEIEDEI